MEVVGQTIPPAMRDAMHLQQQAMQRWVRRQLGSIDHERRVMEIGLKIFDLTWPLHGLDRGERRLLQLAAVVHDVGRAVDEDTYAG